MCWENYLGVDSGRRGQLGPGLEQGKHMLKTTFTGKGRLGLLLCLTGLLSFATLAMATAVRAQDDPRPADNTMASPDGTMPQDDPRYNNPNGGDRRNNNDPRYNDNSNGN